ncbi:MAG: hypothetical protein N3D11_08265 [Candidatus Sumerlaeia bacterium]|nr:hypothetical protein [Candidatus Sumerlaeia bacterium]
MRNPRLQTLLSAMGLVVALALLAIGRFVSHPVALDPAIESPPVIPEFTEDGQIKTPEGGGRAAVPSAISDRELVINATFTGITRIGETLFFTYDPSQPRGKQACPT